MKNSLKSQLKKYSALSAGLIACSASLEASIVKNTINYTGGYNDSHNIDIDGDGSPDFQIYQNNFSMGSYPVSSTYFKDYIDGLYLKGWYQNKMVGAILPKNISTDGYYLYNNADLGSERLAYLRRRFFYQSYGNSSTVGNWANNGGSQDSFGYFYNQGPNTGSVGVKFDINGNTHYGFVRIEFSTFYSWRVTEVVYEDQPNTGIYYNSSFTNASPGVITNSDYSNRQLTTTFAASLNEESVSEYRLFVVKEGTAFDLSEAEGNSNYVAIAPDGSSNYTHVFSASSPDTDGDIFTKSNSSAEFLDTDGQLIAADQNYQVYVLNMAATPYTYRNSLSTPSDVFTILEPVSAPSASNIMPSDISNNGNGSDLKVEYSSVQDETMISEYRLFVVKSENVNVFDVAVAESNLSYKDILPNGNSVYTINYSSSDTDVDGDLIQENQPYTIFVLSMADGVNTNVNNLSEGSSSITLKSILTLDEVQPSVDVYFNNSVLNLTVDNSLIGSQIEIVDMLGRRHFISELQEIDSRIILSLPVGAYIITVRKDNYISNKKFLVGGGNQ